MFRTALLAAVVPLALGSEYSYTYDYCAVASVSSATGGRQGSARGKPTPHEIREILNGDRRQ